MQTNCLAAPNPLSLSRRRPDWMMASMEPQELEITLKYIQVGAACARSAEGHGKVQAQERLYPTRACRSCLYLVGDEVHLVPHAGVSSKCKGRIRLHGHGTAAKTAPFFLSFFFLHSTICHPTAPTKLKIPHVYGAQYPSAARGSEATVGFP
ncbi:hypothetical protein CDEST_06829 [Colletotrichum destructivum]|uniref:Uncharacterized protein n=1 Tax=Colletotrichum destructivum TaxID=34406 RepID=A0AAX4IER4_9PEZI|nr:hypothetical protein CDEST_06829 [Colletotrichum destructivum]